MDAFIQTMALCEARSKRGTHDERREFLLDALRLALDHVPADRLPGLLENVRARADGWVVAWDKHVHAYVALEPGAWNASNHEKPVERELEEDEAVAAAAHRNATAPKEV